jgi:hypothetical protein
LDHILPQGYLSGFTGYSNRGKLWVLDLKQRRWFESGTRNVGAVRGFYDYSPGSAPDQTADEAFARLEGQFPNVRRELVSGGFSAWTSHLSFLLEYAQMLRARSKLFREHALLGARHSTILEVQEVVQEPGKTELKARPLVLGDADRETLLRNMTITKMRGEIAQGSGLFSKLNWCLRFTTNSANPVITAEDPVIVEGRAPTLERAFQDPETLIFFPVCWQACLIGSLTEFDTKTDAFLQSDLGTLQVRYLSSACRFVYSPTRLALPEPPGI